MFVAMIVIGIVFISAVFAYVFCVMSGSFSSDEYKKWLKTETNDKCDGCPDEQLSECRAVYTYCWKERGSE